MEEVDEVGGVREAKVLIDSRLDPKLPDTPSLTSDAWHIPGHLWKCGYLMLALFQGSSSWAGPDSETCAVQLYGIFIIDVLKEKKKKGVEKFGSSSSRH